MPMPQYSLRATIVATTAIAFLLCLVINPRTIDALRYGILCAVVGAVIGRLTGRDRIDAVIAAVVAFMAGAALALSLPEVRH